MTLDALDPGPDWTFPNVPRTPDGWLDTTRIPVGPSWQRGPDGRAHRVNLMPTVRDQAGNVCPITDFVPAPPGTTETDTEGRS